MCYAVYISTDSPDDLRRHNSELVRFKPVAGPSDDPCVTLLRFEHRWLVGTKQRWCCAFRHPIDPAVGFTDPADWCHEDPEDLDATRELYRALSCLLTGGSQVDLIDHWEGAGPDDITDMRVALDGVRETAFRLFENHRFALTMRIPRAVD